MKNHVITADKLYVTMKDMFSDYANEVDRVTAETVVDVSKEGRKYIKDKTLAVYSQKRFTIHSPSKYQNCFRTKKLDKFGRQIKNTRYQLSHLLEDGHKVSNQYGSNYSIYNSEYGTSGKTTKEFKVWEQTEDMLREYFPKKLEENIGKIK